MDAIRLKAITAVKDAAKGEGQAVEEPVHLRER